MTAAEMGASTLGRVTGDLVGRLRAVVNPSAHRSAVGSAPGWLVVTVLCDPDELDAAPLPVPLAEFGDRIEVMVRPAPRGKGGELSARLLEAASSGNSASRLSGQDPQAELRSALRKAKQLIEVGEVLAVDPAPHGSRTATPGGVLLETWTRAASKAGVR